MQKIDRVHVYSGKNTNPQPHWRKNILHYTPGWGAKFFLATLVAAVSKRSLSSYEFGRGSLVVKRSAFDQVFEFDRGRIVAYRYYGLSFKEIGSRVGRNQTTAMRICDRWMRESTMNRRG
ncbi:HTH_38 domain-containing protein [Trichonephila clavipes]|nr:HTH_38 domain-containing protein [Trichonephila clavipes]